MRKSPIGGNAPLADGSHHSERAETRLNAEDRVKNLVGTVEMLTGEGGARPDPEPEYGSGRACPAEQTNNTGENVAQSRADNRSTGRLGDCNSRQGKNRRPGRRVIKENRKIEYPPKPNRRRQGLVSVQNGNERSSNGKKDYKRLQHRAGRAGSKKLIPLYAALDLGTNNCRLLVAMPQQSGNFRVVDAFSRIVRLGKGLEKSGRLDDSAMDRAVEALAQCAQKIRKSNIKKMRLIATEACRRAENGGRFLERVKTETGLELEIIDRKTEAQLAAEGCCALVDRKADGAVLFDIGGGSSELILLDRRGKKNKRIDEQISSWTSLPVGVVTLSERHGGRHVSRKMFDAMVEEVDGHIAKFDGRKILDEFWNSGRVHLLGTSGTVTTLAGVHLKLPRYDRQQVDGIWLKDHQIDDVIEQLIEMDFNKRAANPCIGRERADLVLAGCAILQAIRNIWPSPRLRVADRGLREGILMQLMNQDGVWNNHKGNSKLAEKRKKRRTNNRGKPACENGANHG